MNYILYFDWSALVVFLVIFINMLFKKTIRTKKSDAFLLLVAVSFVSDALDLATAYMIRYSDQVPLAVNNIFNVLYLLMFNATALLFFIYVLTLTDKAQRLTRKRWLMIFIPYGISTILITTSPLTHAVFYFDENLAYMHGAPIYLLYVIAESYLLASFVLTIANRHIMTKEQAFSTYFFLGGSIIAVFVQMIIPELLIVQFASAITIQLIYMTLQNPEDYYDRFAGTLNKKAFITVLKEKSSSKKSVDIVAVKIFDINYLSHALGFENSDKIIAKVIEKLLGASGKLMFFKLSHAKYAFVADPDKEIFSTLPGIIEKLFSVPFEYEGLSISLSASTCCISQPEIAKNPEDVISLIDYYLEIKSLEGSGNVMWAETDVLREHEREEILLNLMREALANDGFYVVYQPIYSADDKDFTDAEALVRLKSTDTLGFVSPEEFVPLAEKNGLITQMGDIVVHKVCAFLADGKPEKLKHVNVNLSVVQCMQEDLHERLTAIIDRYGLDRDLIRFEITETSAAYSSEVLTNNMNKLISNGMQFAMDDFGSGFSGTGYLIDYPFATVKIDKHIVWEAFKNEKAMSVLKNTVKMIKEMKMSIVAEGIETQQYADTLIEMGCDLLQGYLYSRPITSDRFVEFLEKDYCEK